MPTSRRRSNLPNQTSGVSWQLSSHGGREQVTWHARRAEGTGDEAVLTCDIVLVGRFFGETLGSGPPDASPDFSLEIRGLAVRIPTLQRLHDHLTRWLDLPLAEMRTARLEVDCDMGGLFDQDVRLILGDRQDTLSSGRPIATLKYLVGRMSGELSFVTDPTCLVSLRDGVDAAIRWGSRTPPVSS